MSLASGRNTLQGKNAASDLRSNFGKLTHDLAAAIQRVSGEAAVEFTLPITRLPEEVSKRTDRRNQLRGKVAKVTRGRHARHRIAQTSLLGLAIRLVDAYASGGCCSLDL